MEIPRRSRLPTSRKRAETCAFGLGGLANWAGPHQTVATDRCLRGASLSDRFHDRHIATGTPLGGRRGSRRH